MNLLSKEEARSRLKQHLPVLERREEFESQILTRFFPLLSGKEKIISYVADLAWEVDLLPLVESCPLPRPAGFWELRHSAKWYFPKMMPEKRLDFVRPWEWEKNKWGIWEPKGEEKITVEEADLILVPALGFSSDGTRLGRGGGFYDRLLSSDHLRTKTIGFCFSKFFPVPFAPEAHDCKIGKIITESRIISFLD
ncbi:5-formyltetrahydrofolate cyclo-ligase [Leptospira idonii]|uniref:5-formyltetrahydrofolate cyclo-ligase n=1 Tax=Leptospira idonii TaxID=1193500 RepID=A0A4R9LUU8_9LEPT|nr:5-formyltetrahydrofolate cyclo-ligase [Leptospira idonii]TGN17706.1 5-formyltetrahydrofolate cyclo-ligase [Leptospira idonii]